MKANSIKQQRGYVDPPLTLMLQRKSIQNFPDNQKVALYYCRDLKKFFSLTYSKNGFEIMESDFSVIEKLKNIQEIEPLCFHDGSELNIDKRCSENILSLYENLSEGKEEFEDYILSSDKNFLSEERI